MLSLARGPAREDWRHGTARIGTALGFVVLAGLAFAAIAASVPAALASPLVAAEQLVNLCTFVLFLLEASFVMLRPRPVAQASGFVPAAVALLGTWLMAFLVLLPSPASPAPAAPAVGIVLGLAGDGLAIASVLALGRSFSVMPAARALVAAGPYRWMRHPLYVAEEIAICGLLAVHFSVPAIVLFAVQAACQCARARNEERVLAAALPQYEAYRAQTPALLPHIDPAVLWIGAVSFAVAAFLGPRLLADPDSFLHVAAGAWMWAHGTVPHADPFSATLAGAPWSAHEWLSELVFAAAFAGLGWTGVVLVTALAIAATFAVLGHALLRTLPPRGAVLLLAFGFLLVAPHLVARPHVLAMLATVAFVAGLLRARAEDRAPSLALLPVLALWANLHGSSLLGLFLAGALAAEAWLAAPAADARRRSAVAWGVFLLAAAATTILTPLGLAGWRLPAALDGMSFSLSLVGEWQAADFSHFQPLELWLLGLPALMFGRSIRVPWLRLALLLLFTHLALVHARFIDTVALLGPLLLAPSLEPLFGSAAPARMPARGAVSVALALLLAASAAGLTVVRGTVNANPRIAPAAALAAAGPGTVFNDYDFGDFLIFSGIAPFVDGRIDLYGDRFMHRYIDALDADGDALPDLLAQYGVGWTILKPDRPAVALLDRLPGWHRAYADASAVVHVRDP